MRILILKLDILGFTNRETEELCWSLKGNKILRCFEPESSEYSGSLGIDRFQKRKLARKYLNATRCMRHNPDDFYPNHGCVEQVRSPTKMSTPELTSKAVE
jgi:hypothetical protein